MNCTLQAIYNKNYKNCHKGYAIVDVDAVILVKVSSAERCERNQVFTYFSDLKISNGGLFDLINN